MNELTNHGRSPVAALVESASINSAVRMTGVLKPMILKLLADLGAAFATNQDEKFGNLPPESRSTPAASRTLSSGR